MMFRFISDGIDRSKNTARNSNNEGKIMTSTISGNVSLTTKDIMSMHKKAEEQLRDAASKSQIVHNETTDADVCEETIETLRAQLRDAIAELDSGASKFAELRDLYGMTVAAMKRKINEQK